MVNIVRYVKNPRRGVGDKKTKKSNIMKKVRSGSKKVRSIQDTIAVVQVQEVIEEPKIEVPPKELFAKWLRRYSLSEIDGEYGGSDDFVCAHEINGIVSKLDYSTVERVILETAYIGLNNPDQILPALDYDRGSEALRNKVKEYLAGNTISRWNMSFIEIIARTCWCQEIVNDIPWSNVFSSYNQSVRNRLKELAKESSVSETEHSKEFYLFMFDMFAYGSDETDSSFIARRLSDCGDGSNEERCALMKGMIKMAKKDVFLWDFEDFMR